MKANKEHITRTQVDMASNEAEARFKKNEALARLITTMTSNLKRRAQKTSWIKDATRAEIIERYADVLDVSTDVAVRDFVRWVVEDARYLAVEGNFQMFAHVYLMAEMEESIWELAGDSGNKQLRPEEPVI